jgi:hypothetical protein
MKLAILATLAASTAAFAPSKVAQTSTALNAFESELGVQPPLGFFDSNFKLVRFVVFLIEP